MWGLENIHVDLGVGSFSSSWGMKGEEISGEANGVVPRGDNGWVIRWGLSSNNCPPIVRDCSPHV